MTRLLVSVRDASEALAALAGGADIIDVKEPNRGSLGMADGDAVACVVEAVGERVPVSVALGELREWRDERSPAFSKNRASGTHQLPGALAYAKLGLSGLTSSDNWVHDWLECRTQIEAANGIAPRWIAVGYVDWQSADAPSLDEVIRAARDTDCAGVLFDTYSKSDGNLLDWLPLPELTERVAAIREAGLLAALAGGIGEKDVPQLVGTEPDILAIRTAACEGGRNGTVTESAVRRFRAAMDSAARPIAAASSHSRVD